MYNSLAFHVMVKPTGPLCNLDCEYCYYLEKENLYGNKTDWGMKHDVLEKFIKEYINTQAVPVISFTWQGGEPTLLGLDFFEEAVNLQKKYANGKRIINSFQTNGLLIDDKWCRFFKDNNFLIGLSVDGPQKVHDRYRVLKGGKPTFEKVMKGLDLLKHYAVEFNTLTCVTKYSSHRAVEVYNFLKNTGSRYMQFIPIVERRATIQGDYPVSLVAQDYKDAALVTKWSVEPLQYGRFLWNIFQEWVRNDVGAVFVNLFDVALEAWTGRNPNLCVFREKCGQGLVMEHNGDLYSCDHYVYPEHKLGNIMEDSMKEMVDSDKQIKFGADKYDRLPKYCLDCEYRFACNGECPKHRSKKTPSGEEGLNYLCEGYKFFFRNIDPYMRFMAGELENERPPMNVMEWVRDGRK